MVVPRTYGSKVLYMAHSHLLGPHLGMDESRESRVLDRFYWPGVKRDIEDYSRACPRMPTHRPETLGAESPHSHPPDRSPV